MSNVNPSVTATPISEDDLAFIAHCFETHHFQVAKTMPQNPHAYTLRKRWESDEDFQRCVLLIRAHGYQEKYGRATYTLLRVGNFKYWTMGCPLFVGERPWQETTGSVTILINRKEIGIDGPDR